jgi:hypothetical protein
MIDVPFKTQDGGFYGEQKVVKRQELFESLFPKEEIDASRWYVEVNGIKMSIMTEKTASYSRRVGKPTGIQLQFTDRGHGYKEKIRRVSIKDWKLDEEKFFEKFDEMVNLKIESDRIGDATQERQRQVDEFRKRINEKYAEAPMMLSVKRLGAADVTLCGLTEDELDKLAEFMTNLR